MAMTFNLAKFDPLSYDEIVKPLLLATDMQNQYEDALGTLATQASIWEKLANSALDQREYNIYKLYQNKLELATNQLLSSGLLSNSRMLINGLKTLYAKDIQPISDAWTLREKLREEERKQDAATGNRTIREKSTYDMGLSDFINGAPEIKAYNLNILELNVGNRASTLAKQLIHPESKEKLNALLYKLTLQYGLTMDDIMAFTLDPTSDKALPVLRTLYQEAMNESGIDSWDNRDEVIGAVDSAIMGGLMKGLGEVKLNYWTNEVAKMLMEQAYKLLAAAAAAKAKAKTKETPTVSPELVNRYSLRRRNEIEEELLKYANYVTIENGKPVLKEGALKDVIISGNNNSITSVMGGSTLLLSRPSAFKTWYATNILGDPAKAYSKLDPDEVAAAMYDAITKGMPDYNKDGMRHSMLHFGTEDAAVLRTLKSKLLSSTDKAELTEYDIDEKGTKLIPTGDTLTKEELKKSDSIVKGTYESPLGTLVIVEDSEGKYHYIKADLDAPLTRNTILNSYNEIKNIELVYRNSLKLEATLMDKITKNEISAEEALKIIFDLIQKNQYVSLEEYSRLVNYYWSEVQNARAKSLRTIDALPLTYGYSSTNIPYSEYSFND